MKKSHVLLASCACAALILSGCKSTPVEETEEVEEIQETVEQADYTDSNNALLEKLNEARQSAVDAGADKYCAEGFAAAETEYQALVLSAEDSSVDISKAAKDLNSRYEALSALAGAYSKKKTIDDNGYASFNQSAYDRGTAVLDELSVPGASLTLGKTFLDKASQADSEYSAVLNAAYRSLAKDERDLAIEAKRNADSVKAAVSRKDEYDAAVGYVTKGDSNFVTQRADLALENYRKGKEEFIRLYTEIADARKQAQAAIEAAKARVAEAEKAAVIADEENPLDEDAAGIESEDAKLLEDDDFSSTENAAVEIEALESEEGDE